MDRSGWEVGDLVWHLGYHGVVERAIGLVVRVAVTLRSGSRVTSCVDTSSNCCLIRRYTVDVPRSRLETLAWRSTRREHRVDDEREVRRILVLRSRGVTLESVQDLTDVELLRRIPPEVRSGIVDSRDAFGLDEFASLSPTLLREAAAW